MHPKRSQMHATSISSMRPIRVGIVGTGYIADFHARAIRAARGVELVSVCDVNLSNARSFATDWGVPAAAYGSLEPMIKDQQLDAVHVLVPPDQHYSLGSTALQSGLHVFLEKPMCVSPEEADELLVIARNSGLRLGVNHNMLYSGAYRRLRDLVHSGHLGPLDYVSVNHFLELAAIRLGPFNTWMLRAPENVILEIGPHLLSAVLDIAGMPDQISVTADRGVNLPNRAHVLRRWRIHTTVGRIAVDVHINLGPGFSQRTINVHGMLGSATVDFDANTCTFDRRTPLSIDLDRFKRTRSQANQLRAQASETLNDYILSNLKLRRRGNPYQVTILDSVESFYSSLRSDSTLDSRIDGGRGRDVVELCSRIASAGAKERLISPAPRRRVTPAITPTVLVIGAAGFIGRELVRQLLAAGYCVRAVVHNSDGVFEELASNSLEIVHCDIRSEADLESAIKGIEFVYHLARSNAKTWADYVKREVEPIRLIGKVCLAAGVKRLIYTGTIDSYYAGTRAGTITEDTPLDPNIDRRNYYARAKAAAEEVLIEMHRTERLPVVIFRPGIVIGRGGNPFHWGVGMWASEGVCVVWGEGKNKLPLVLVADVAAALVRGISAPDIEGRSYNLIGEPLLTAREYLDELQRRSGMKLTVGYGPIWRFYLNDLSKWLVKLAVAHPDRSRVPSYLDWESRTQKAFFNCRRARVELDWAPCSDRQRMMDEGIGGSLQSWLEASH